MSGYCMLCGKDWHESICDECAASRQSSSKALLEILNDMALVEKIAYAGCCNEGDECCAECNARFGAVDNYRLTLIRMISNRPLCLTPDSGDKK